MFPYIGWTDKDVDKKMLAHMQRKKNRDFN